MSGADDRSTRERAVPEHADVVLIGLGSGGENAATSLAEKGLTVVGVTDGLVGGECPFLACMPSKVLLHDAHVHGDAARAIERRDEVVDHRDDHSHAKDLVEAGVHLVRGRARISGVREVTIDGDAGRHVVRADHVVIATGAAPNALDVPGAEAVEVWDSEDVYAASALPERAVVVGGGAIGCETALMLAGFGCAVTLLHRGPHLLDTEDQRVGEVLTAALRDRGVDVVLDDEVASLAVDGDDVVVTTDGGQQRRVDRVIAAIGRTPRRDGLGLEAVGVNPEGLGAVDGWGRVPGTDWLWALGDVRDDAPYTHAANAQAERLVAAITGEDAPPFDRDLAPRTVYTDPPVYAVGVPGSEADEQGLIRVEVTHDDLARPVTDRTGDGVQVLLVDEDGRVRGFAACGARADEYGTAAGLAMQLRASAHDLARSMPAFPTHAEGLKELGRRAVDALQARRSDG